MTEGVNRQWTLASRPEGYPARENFALVESPIEDPGVDQLLVQTMWMSLDPYMRGRMAAARSYAAPVDIGGVMQGTVVGRVVESRAAGICARRHRRSPAWLAGPWRGQRSSSQKGRPITRAGVHRPWGAGYARPDGILRPARGWAGQTRRRGGRLRGIGRRGSSRGPDRVADGVHGRRNGRYRREGRVCCGRVGLRQRHQLQDGRRGRRPAFSMPRRGRRVLRQRWRRCDRCRHEPDSVSGAGGDMRADIAVQPRRA